MSSYAEILDDPLIKVLDKDEAEGVFDIRLLPLKTRITIDVGLCEVARQPRFLMTHAMHTPIQAFPHKSGNVYASTRRSALNKALLYLTMHYKMALNKGYKPKESWLVPWETCD